MLRLGSVAATRALLGERRAGGFPWSFSASGMTAAGQSAHSCSNFTTYRFQLLPHHFISESTSSGGFVGLHDRMRMP